MPRVGSFGACVIPPRSHMGSRRRDRHAGRCVASGMPSHDPDGRLALASIDPAASIATCEQALRQLLRSIVEQHDPLTLEEWAGAARIEKWRERSQVEAKKRQPRGVATTSADLLDYSDLFDLLTMCEKHWSWVAPALGRGKEVLSLLKRLDDLRNTVAHGRQLVPFEVDLVAGIAGDIRNRVTIYLSTQDPGGDYFPRIESVTDEFGNVLDGSLTLHTSNPLCDTGLTLRVGDRVRFVCQATDPQGRQLRWTLRNHPDSTVEISAEGNDSKLEWVVGPGAIGQRSTVQITMIAVGVEYHRWEGIHDGLAMFNYRVLPAGSEMA